MAKRTRKVAAKPRWQQWTAAEARRVLKAWRASRLPLATFARKRGLCPERVRWWRQRLGDGHAPGQEPLRLVPAVVTGLRPSTASTVVTVRAPGDVVVEIADVGAVSPAWVRRSSAGSRGRRHDALAAGGEGLRGDGPLQPAEVVRRPFERGTRGAGEGRAVRARLRLPEQTEDAGEAPPVDARRIHGPAQAIGAWHVQFHGQRG
jgi:hypothetical protein